MLALLRDRPAAAPRAPNYPAYLDAGTPLGRTRRALREALAALPSDADGPESRPLPPALRPGAPILSRLTRADLTRMLDDIDGSVSDLAPPPQSGHSAVETGGTLPASALDPDLSVRLTRANRALREGDKDAYAALRAAAERFSTLAGAGIPTLASRHGIDPVRASHLATLLGTHPSLGVPLGTVAYALSTLEGLAYRHARAPAP